MDGHRRACKFTMLSIKKGKSVGVKGTPAHYQIRYLLSGYAIALPADPLCYAPIHTSLDNISQCISFNSSKCIMYYRGHFEE